MAFILISHAVIVFDAFHLLDLAISALRYLVFFYLFIIFIRQSVDKVHVYWLVFFIYLLLTTMLGHGSIANVIGPAIDTIILLMMFYVFRDNVTGILKAVTIALSFYIYLNLILLFLYPDGLWMDPISGKGYYLLSGNYNGMGARFVCALTTNLLICKNSLRAKINLACLIVVSFVSVLFVRSMTSTVSIVMLLTLWIMARSRMHSKLVVAFFIFYVLVQLFVVFLLSDLSNITALVNFFENILHKDTTFTQRSFLWESSARLISESPWLGYGYHDKTWNELKLGGPGSHNFVYTILLYGGYPLLGMFVTIVISSLRRNVTLFGERNLSYLLLGVTVFFFMMIFEYYVFFITAYLLTLIYYYPSLSSKCKPHDTRALHT